MIWLYWGPQEQQKSTVFGELDNSVVPPPVEEKDFWEGESWEVRFIKPCMTDFHFTSAVPIVK